MRQQPKQNKLKINKKLLIILALPIFFIVLINFISISFISFSVLPELQSYIKRKIVEEELQLKGSIIKLKQFQIQFQLNQLLIYMQLLDTINQQNVLLNEQFQGNLYAQKNTQNSENNASPDSFIYNKLADPTQFLQVTGWSDTSYSSIESLRQDTDKNQSLQQGELILAFARIILSINYFSSLAQNRDQFYFFNLSFINGLNVYIPAASIPNIFTMPPKLQYKIPNCFSDRVEEDLSYLTRACQLESPMHFFSPKNVSNQVQAFKQGYTAQLGDFGNQNYSKQLTISGFFDFVKQKNKLEKIITNKGELFITLSDLQQMLILYSYQPQHINQELKHVLQMNQPDLEKYLTNLNNVVSEHKKTCQDKDLNIYNFTTQVQDRQEWTLVGQINLISEKVQVENGTIIQFKISENCINTYLIVYNVFEYQLTAFLKSTFQQIDILSLITYIIIMIISLIISIIIFRYALDLTLSLEGPITLLTAYINTIFRSQIDLEYNDSLLRFNQQYTSKEIKALYQVIIALKTNIRYSKQIKFGESAFSLLELSKAKQFYNEIGNTNAVGICCNNIANIHQNEGRFFEALAEYQESIIMAQMEFRRVRKEMKSFLRGNNINMKDYIVNVVSQSLFISRQKLDHKERLSINIPKSEKMESGFQSAQQSQFIILQDKSNSCRFEEKSVQIQDDQDQDTDSIDFVYNLGIQRLISRKFSLGCAIIRISNHCYNNFYSEAAKIFKQCIYLLKNKQRISQLNIRLRLLACINLARCNAMQGKLDEAEMNVRQAQKHFDSIFAQMSSDLVEPLCFRDRKLPMQNVLFIQQEVFEQWIDTTQAVIQTGYGNFKTASTILTDNLINGKYYDEQCRQFQLGLLDNIFKFHNIPQVEIEQIQQTLQCRSIDLFIMIDYSREMSSDQIKTAHSVAHFMFKQLSSMDKIGFIIYNDIVHVNFYLQVKSKNEHLLEKKLCSISLSPGGNSNLYQALLFACTQFDENKQKSYNNSSNHLRFILIFAEKHPQINFKEYKTLQKKLKDRNLNLMIYKIQNTNDHTLKFKQFSRITPLGRFFIDRQQASDFFEQCKSTQKYKSQVFEEF